MHMLHKGKAGFYLFPERSLFLSYPPVSWLVCSLKEVVIKDFLYYLHLLSDLGSVADRNIPKAI